MKLLVYILPARAVARRPTRRMKRQRIVTTRQTSLVATQTPSLFIHKWCVCVYMRAQMHTYTHTHTHPSAKHSKRPWVKSFDQRRRIHTRTCAHMCAQTQTNTTDTCDAQINWPQACWIPSCCLPTPNNYWFEKESSLCHYTSLNQVLFPVTSSSTAFDLVVVRCIQIRSL